MVRKTRSNVSKAGSSNNNDGRRPPLQPKNVENDPPKDKTPDGDVQDLDEHGNPRAYEEAEDLQSKSDGRREDSRYDQLDLDATVKGFLEANRRGFLEYLNQQNRPHNDGNPEASSASPSPPKRNRSQSPLRQGRSKSPARRGRSPSPGYRRKSPSLQIMSTRRARGPPTRDRLGAHRARDDRDNMYTRRDRRRHRSLSDDELGGGMDGFDKYGRIITPFSNEVLSTPLPNKYKVPNIAPYDGLRDLQNFLSQFQYSMINQQLGHVHMCKLFRELLINNARRWFDSLPPGSIGSYRELMTAFHRRFFQKAESKTTSAHLLTVRQGRGESITDFMECLKVEDVNDLLIISAFQNGIHPGALYKEIVKYEPRTAAELWRIIDRFAKADEADRKKREADRTDTSDKKKRDDDRGDRRKRRSALDRLQRGPLESRLGPRRDSEQFQYTPLTKTRAEIYELHANLFE